MMQKFYIVPYPLLLDFLMSKLVSPYSYNLVKYYLQLSHFFENCFKQVVHFQNFSCLPKDLKENSAKQQCCVEKSFKFFDKIVNKKDVLRIFNLCCTLHKLHHYSGQPCGALFSFLVGVLPLDLCQDFQLFPTKSSSEIKGKNVSKNQTIRTESI